MTKNTKDQLLLAAYFTIAVGYVFLFWSKHKEITNS